MARLHTWRTLASAALLVGVIAASLLPADPRPAQAAEVVVYDLPHILALADANHPNVAAARARVTQARAQLDEAHFAPFVGGFKVSGGVGVAPTVQGNNIFSPNTNVSLTSSLAFGWRTTIEGVVPLWTFGKITNGWDAAGANVRVKEDAVEQERDAVRLDVRKAYFGLQLARDSKLLLKEVRSSLDKAIEAMQKAVDKDKGDPIDLLRIQTYSADLEARQLESERYDSVALAGLRFYTGVSALDIPDEPIRPPKHELGHVSRYLTAATLYRPEVAMAKHGIEARTAQVQLARSQLLPDIAVGASLSTAAAPAVALQLNPYVIDPANYFRYGVALVFNWKLDFPAQVARIKQAEAQLEETRQLQRLALGGAGAEVEQAYAEVVDWKKRVEVFTKAVKTAKRWLVLVQEGIDMGTTEEKELLEPSRAYATNKFNQLNAVMELDMAMSRLAKATGWDAIAPDGT